MTAGSPPSMTATTEFVVPRSIPMTLLILWFLLVISMVRLILVYVNHLILVIYTHIKSQLFWLGFEAFGSDGRDWGQARGRPGPDPGRPSPKAPQGMR